ncbi:hypothetical protein NQZ68_019344 [Dissostichus eleginoides]|nr:hypothetical protein NQZ68_019344 [Dissostichus eleginoides]
MGGTERISQATDLSQGGHPVHGGLRRGLAVGWERSPRRGVADMVEERDLYQQRCAGGEQLVPGEGGGEGRSREGAVGGEHTVAGVKWTDGGRDGKSKDPH